MRANRLIIEFDNKRISGRITSFQYKHEGRTKVSEIEQKRLVESYKCAKYDNAVKICRKRRNIEQAVFIDLHGQKVKLYKSDYS